MLWLWQSRLRETSNLNDPGARLLEAGPKGLQVAVRLHQERYGLGICGFGSTGAEAGRLGG